MIGGCARQSGRNSAQWTARRLSVGHKFHLRRSPRRINLRGNENLLGLELQQNLKLDLPEWRVSKPDCRLVLAHSARFAAGKEHCANPHSAAVGSRAVEYRTPSVRIRARTPPRPLRKTSAPGPIA